MRLINWILLSPLILIAISFAVSNREAVDLTLWPLPFSVSMPLVLFGFIMILIGFLAGGCASWFAGQNKRKQARDTRKKASELDKKVQSLETELAAEKKAMPETHSSSDASLLVAENSTPKLPAKSKWSAAE